MSNTTKHAILLIEDNPGDIRLINDLLNEITAFQYTLFFAKTLKEGCEQLLNGDFTVVLLDLNLPDSTGKYTFNKILEVAKEIPIVLITGLQDVELSLSFVKEGAQDYIIKADLNSGLLLKTIYFAVERKKLLNELLKKTKSLQQTMSYFTDRELKMIELKKEINELLKSNGQEKRYFNLT